VGDANVAIRPASEPGDLGWMIMAHGEIYAREYGWDSSFEVLVARILTDFANTDDPDRAQAWIGEVDGRRAGCVMCCAADESTAELHTLLVEPWARGHRLGARLVDQCLEFARGAGYTRMKLWTNDPLVAARHIYQSRGFRLVREEPHRSFGMDMIGQYYELDLHQPGSPDLGG
jgi:N-acetylglutamate synthase-like GNAT family acetyltransferase